MVFCIVAIVVFGILGIFSAKYRTYFKEALRCVSRQATLRKCDTNFDNTMKSKLTAKLLKFPRIAKFVYNRFSVISWIFVVMLFASAAFIVVGVYNAAIFGNCEGEESTGFCIFNPEGTGDSGYSAQDGIDKPLTPALPDDDPYIGGKDANITIIEFGCFSCKYTRKAEAVRKQVLSKYGDKVKFIFRNFPLPSHKFSNETAEASNCAMEQGKYWEYHDKLFDNQKNISIEKIKEISLEIGLNGEKFNQCFDSGKYKTEVEKDYLDGLESGISKTPTFFVNGRPLIGSQNIGVFSKIIDEELAKSK